MQPPVVISNMINTGPQNPFLQNNNLLNKPSRSNTDSVNKASPSPATFLKATPRVNIIRNENMEERAAINSISASVKSRRRGKALADGINNVTLFV